MASQHRQHVSCSLHLSTSPRCPGLLSPTCWEFWRAQGRATKQRGASKPPSRGEKKDGKPTTAASQNLFLSKQNILLVFFFLPEPPNAPPIAVQQSAGGSTALPSAVRSICHGRVCDRAEGRGSHGCRNHCTDDWRKVFPALGSQMVAYKIEDLR